MKKLRLTCLFASLGLSVALFAQPAPAQNASDTEYANFRSIADQLSQPPPKELAEKGPNAIIENRAEIFSQLRQAALAFYERHPDDARRWKVVLELLNAPPFLIKKQVSDTPKPAYMPDQEAIAAWQVQLDKLSAAALEAKDTPLELRELVDWKSLRRSITDKRRIQDADWVAWNERFEKHLASYPDTPALLGHVDEYLGILERSRPGQSLQHWRSLAASQRTELRELAEKRVRFFSMLEKPLELSFTATDGRKIDLADLRGKVVLLDFWATWCGPCVAELPNVKKVYEAYHDKGFEVIGISLDSPDSRKKLNDFVAKKELPWPQYHDIENKKNPLVARFSITQIPTVFLLDQTGKVVSTNARGKTLETEVKRLLKL